MSESKFYIPKPFDTKSITLTAELSSLIEKTAENLHDVWARKRMDEGWSWGPERNDLKRTTPCLVPYGDLPESEKDYDRSMAVETIKTLLAMGYKIEK